MTISITDLQGLDALCARCGIALGYHDIRGQLHQPGSAVKQALLAALQVPVNSNDDIYRQRDDMELRQWRECIPPVVVGRQNEGPLQLVLTLAAAETDEVIGWEISEENGERRQGEWSLGAEDSLDERVVEGNLMRQFEVSLPDIENSGYHRLSVHANSANAVQSTLIIAPATCYQPPEFEQGRKIWGISLQLFSLRSQRNWGIGDFTDLNSAVEVLAPLGIDVLGLSPLHALFSHLPENASPYSPSSRRFLNPVYLDIEAIDEYQGDDLAQAKVSSGQFQADLQELRGLEIIDYPGVWRRKLAVLEALYRGFKQGELAGESARLDAFRQFRQEGGQDLFKFALFEALQANFHRQDGSIDRWQKWPAAYRDPESETVTRWAAAHDDEIGFHQYLQWNAEQQLAAVQQNCRRHGMCIGIYRDLAVGDAESSAQCWANQGDYALGVGVGAPPDEFNANGQNWALPPLQPQALRDRAYGPFINTLRANMRHAGALRIDHIMGLMRLFWVPPKVSPREATYVAYPFADLLGILALESQRNRCLVVGEDLGTVADEVRHAIDTHKMLSYRVLYFEKDWHHGTLTAPQHYPRYALSTSGSHDLPTLRGFWQGTDLMLRERLNLFPSDEFKDQQWQARQRDRREILAALEREQLIDGAANDETDVGEEFNGQLALSIQRYLARSQSMLLMVQLEDLLLQTRQVNVPGTIDEYPNWRGRVTVNLEDWRQEFDLDAFALAIKRERMA